MVGYTGPFKLVNITSSMHNVFIYLKHFVSYYNNYITHNKTMCVHNSHSTGFFLLEETGVTQMNREKHNIFLSLTIYMYLSQKKQTLVKPNTTV